MPFGPESCDCNGKGELVIRKNVEQFCSQFKPKTIDLSDKNVEEYLQVNHLAVETVRHSDNFSGDSETAASECLRSPPSEVILSWST